MVAMTEPDDDEEFAVPMGEDWVGMTWDEVERILSEDGQL